MEAVTPREPVLPQRPTESREEAKLGLQDYSARSKILVDNHKEFLTIYPDQWVAFGDNWKIVPAETHEEVLKKLKEAGGYSPHSMVRRLETNPPRRIRTVWRKRKG